MSNNTDTEQSILSSALETNALEINQLESSIDSLIERLRPVCNQSLATPVSNTQPDTDEPPHSYVATSIYEQAARLNSLTYRIQDLNKVLEV